MQFSDWGKRLLLGRKLRSDQRREVPLRKRIAVPVFASNALSSVAYAPDQVFIVLALGGVAAYALSWTVGIAVAVAMAIVIASYRQNVRVYRSGGGDYQVAMTNLGRPAGLTVASALLVGYSLTVAVSLSAAAQYAAAMVEPLQGYQAVVAVVATLLVMTLNLRGIRESAMGFAIPTYAFMLVIVGMAIWGFGRYLFGELPQASSADLDVVPEQQLESGVTALAATFLAVRAFAFGSAVLTGVEVVSNAVPTFRKPRGRNAGITLMWVGGISIASLLGVIALANIMGVHLVEDPQRQLRDNGRPVGEDYYQHPIISQLADGIFAGFSPAFYVVMAVTIVILILASHTAFKAFALLGSILGRDGFLPKQLHTRGDRLVYSNGILLLTGFAVVVIVAFDAEVTPLIQLYLIGVFVSFTLSQAGMVRHWSRALRVETEPGARRRMRQSQAINALGLVVTGVVLLVVLVTRFTAGAWIAVVAIAILILLMRGVRGHYHQVATELAVDEDAQYTLPSRVHAVVLVSKLHKPALRALAYAGTTRPDVLEGVTVDVDSQDTQRLMAEWDRREIPVPLRVLASPYREITRPILDYIRSIRRASPRDIVTVYIPEYVVGHWWEQLLHNQSATRLKARLLVTPGVMVTSVPYQLASSEAAQRRAKSRAEASEAEQRGG